MTSVFSIAVSGLNAALARLSNAATNIVNVSSTGRLPSASGEKRTAFAPQDVVTLSQNGGGAALGVTTATRERDLSYVPAYDPSSPDANAQGLVAVPNVDLTQEIVTTLTAEIAYKASAKVVQVEKRNEETLLNTLT